VHDGFFLVFLVDFIVNFVFVNHPISDGGQACLMSAPI
jgi:hypothetical protein